MSESRLTNILAMIYQNSSADTKRVVLSALIVSNKSTHLLEYKSQFAAVESGNHQTQDWSSYCGKHYPKQGVSAEQGVMTYQGSLLNKGSQLNKESGVSIE